MRLIKFWSIKKKLFAVILFITGCALLLVSIGIISYERVQSQRSIVTDLTAMVDVIGNNTAAALCFEDVRAATEILSALSAKPGLIAGSLRNEDGTQLALYSAPGFEQEVDLYSQWSDEEWQRAQGESGTIQNHKLCLGRNILFNGQKVGSIMLVMDLRILDERFASSSAFAALIFCASFFVAIGMAVELQHVITRPILHLTQVMAKVSESKDYSLRARQFGRDELGHLVLGFNSMIEHVEEGEEALAKSNLELESKIMKRTKALVDAKERAEAANKAKSRFLATMSHEIRTPLNGVVGMLKLLRQSELDNRQKRFVKKGIFSAEALLVVINDILDFSKIEAGKLELEELPVDLVELTENVVQSFACDAEEKGLDLVCFIDRNIPHGLCGDPSRIGQVLLNLISNAVKFTQHGQVLVRLGLESESLGGALVRFDIEDTGVGVSQDQKDRIFEPFQQEDNSTTRRFGGTGLGLGICRELVPLMGGKMGLDIGEEKGATFHFTVHLRKDPNRTTTLRRPHSMRDVRALVVDDHAITRDILRYQLETWGCHVEEAQDGESALKLMRESTANGHSIDIGIVDWNMPGISGEDLGRQIKSDPVLSNTTLILLSSNREMDSPRIHEAGFAAWLAKPARQSELYDAMVSSIRGGSQVAPALSEELKADALSDVRVLLAEDNEINQLVVMEVLKMVDCSCDIVNNGREVIEKFELNEYDVILMDCMMPEMDGYEATRQIRTLETAQVRHIPIIALTANAMTGDCECCLASGMDDYLSKPLDPLRMVETIQKWVGARSKPKRLVMQPDGLDLGDDGAELSFNRNDLLERCMGNHKLADELVIKFLDQVDVDIQLLNDAVSSKTAEEMVPAAHRVKGAAANLSMQPLSTLAGRVEKHARNNELREARKIILSLRAEVEWVRERV